MDTFTNFLIEMAQSDRGWDCCTTTDSLVIQLHCSENNYNVHWCNIYRGQTQCVLYDLKSIPCLPFTGLSITAHVNTEYTEASHHIKIMVLWDVTLFIWYIHTKAWKEYTASEMVETRGCKVLQNICTISTVYFKNLDHKIFKLVCSHIN